MHRRIGPGNIDKIRDILFGSNMRDYEQRFARLEEALEKGIGGSARHHAPPPGIAGSVRPQRTGRPGRAPAIPNATSVPRHFASATDLSVTSTSIFKKIGEMENHEAQAKREIRNDLLQQSKELTDAIRNKGEELIALLERRSQDLQHSKTDRAALAGLFNEVALRLTDQFKVTGAD